MLWTDAKIERLIELYRSFELETSAILQVAPESGAGIQHRFPALDSSTKFPASVSLALALPT